MVQPGAKFPEKPSREQGVSEAPEPWVGSVGFSGEIWSMSPIAVTTGAAHTKEPAFHESHGPHQGPVKADGLC